MSQPTAVSGLSTLLDHTQVTWLADCATEGKLETYEVTTTTVSDQIAAHGLAVVDMLKIDVEGYFLEVLKGISAGGYRQGQKYRDGVRLPAGNRGHAG